MSIRKLNPYLNFDGTAAKAIALYEKALGAKTETVQKFGDVKAMAVRRKTGTASCTRCCGSAKASS